MKGQKSLAQNYIYNMLYQLLAIIAPLITTPYVSRVLAADGLGQYSYTLSIVTYFGLFGKLGLDVYGQLKIAESRNDPQQLSANFWGILAARTVCTLIATCGYLLLILFSHQYRAMYTVLLVFLGSQLFDIIWLCQGLEEFKTVLMRNIIVKLLCTILVFLFVKAKDDLLLYAFLMQGSILVGNLLILPSLKQILVPVKLRDISVLPHLKNSLVYFIPTIATSIYTLLDKSMLGWISASDFENGYYEQAHKIEQILVTVVTALSTVTLPRLKFMFSQGKDGEARNIIDDTTVLVMAIALPMATGLLVMSPHLIPWFLGDGYDKCISLLQVFSLLIPIVGLNNIVGKQCLMATGRQKYYNYGVIAGACTNVALNLLLIPGLRSLGATIASVISEAVILLIFVLHAKDYLHAPKYLIPFLKYTLASLLMGLGVYWSGSLLSGTVGIFLQLFTGIVIYGLLLIITGDPLVAKGLNMVKKKFLKK